MHLPFEERGPGGEIDAESAEQKHGSARGPDNSAPVGSISFLQAAQARGLEYDGGGAVAAPICRALVGSDVDSIQGFDVYLGNSVSLVAGSESRRRLGPAVARIGTRHEVGKSQALKG